MKKRVISIIMILAVLISVMPFNGRVSMAASPTSRYYISFCDTILNFEEETLMTNGTILAESDVLCSALGLGHGLNNETNTLTVTNDNTTVIFTADSEAAWVNGDEKALSAAPVVKNGKYMIPAVFLAESFGYKTYYSTNLQKRLAIFPDYSPEAYANLQSIEENCYSEKLIDWIVNLYDPESGGFYFKKSSKDTVGFLPDRESTANCIGMLNTLGVVNKNKPSEFLTGEMKEKMIAFARQYYNPQDGFWYELPWGKYINESKRAYESSGASQVLRMFGATAVPKTASLASIEPIVANDNNLCDECFEEENAIATLNAEDISERYASLENFQAWLDSLSFSSVYSTGSLLLTNLGSIRSAGNEYYDCVIDFINAHMNPRTGFFSAIDPETGDWIDQVNYDSMSGTYKVSAVYGESYYASLGGRYVTIPYFDKLMDSTMTVMLSDETGWHACDLANPWVLIKNAKYSQKDVLGNPAYKAALDRFYEKLPELLKDTEEKILALLCEDGSYSYYADCGAGGNKGVLQGLNLREGEMSGASMVVSLRNGMYGALGLPVPTLFDGKIGPGDIKQKLMAVQPTKKIIPAAKYNRSFDDQPIGDLPKDIGIRYSGDVDICNDPVEGHGKSIKITSDGTLSPVVYFDVGSTGSKGFTVQYDIRFEPVSGNNSYMISTIGSWDTAVWVAFRKYDSHNRFIRTTDTSKWLCNNSGDWWGTYHTIKIVYKPDCNTATTEYYLDGVLKDTSTYYRNGYSEMRPTKDVSYVEFRADHKTPFVGYIDNFKFRENPIA